MIRFMIFHKCFAVEGDDERLRVCASECSLWFSLECSNTGEIKKNKIKIPFRVLTFDSAVECFSVPVPLQCQWTTRDDLRLTFLFFFCHFIRKKSKAVTTLKNTLGNSSGSQWSQYLVRVVSKKWTDFLIVFIFLHPARHRHAHRHPPRVS